MIRSDEMGRTLEQLIANEKTDVVADAQTMATEILLNIHLAELREKVQKTQVEIAKNLGIRQPTVASMEKPGRDLKLSTLKRYVEATGGKLRLDIELPDGSHYQFAI
jgi:DNA-binding XRE family transcriptional regulator